MPNVHRLVLPLTGLLALTTAAAADDDPDPPCGCAADAAAADSPLRPVACPNGHGPDDNDQCRNNQGEVIDPPCRRIADGKMLCRRCDEDGNGWPDNCNWSCKADKSCYSCDLNPEKPGLDACGVPITNPIEYAQCGNRQHRGGYEPDPYGDCQRPRQHCEYSLENFWGHG